MKAYHCLFLKNHCSTGELEAMTLLFCKVTNRTQSQIACNGVYYLQSYRGFQIQFYVFVFLHGGDH